MEENKSQIIIYQTENGNTKIETRLENKTVWLTQAQIAELFSKDRTVITKYINNVFDEGELDKKSNVQILHITNSDRPVKYYNLDIIITVAYRVNSRQAKQFRIWATTLKEFIIKGFVLDEKPHSVRNVSLGKENDTITLQSVRIAS